jgi:signal transduction histidine kinase/ActR/RegA family two-component response regulator
MIFVDTLPLDAIQGRYETVYVVLSFIIAILASYVALDFAVQLRRETSPWLKRYWHVGGAILIGAGVWCMHFTGMLAYNVGMEHEYNIGLTVLSLMLPIACGYIIFAIIRQSRLTWKTMVVASPILGAALLSMHYTGMAAMEMKVQIVYLPFWFLASVVIAVLSSMATIWLMFAYAHRPASRVPFHVLGALTMGLGICGMHYSGTHAALLIPKPDCVFFADYPDRPVILAIAIGVITVLIFAIAVGALHINKIMTRILHQQVKSRTEELELLNQDLYKAKETAESASIAKSEFLANMSHEIRTPMNAVIGITHILRNGMVEPSKREEFMETLQTSAESLMALLNEILDISKIEANKITLEYIEFNLKELIEEIIALLSVRASEKQLTISLKYDHGIGSLFKGDPLRIRQIVVNIISNAIKFTETGGIEIIVRIQKDASVEEEKTPVEILIKDTGIGITETKLKTIFEKFSQEDASTTRKFGGTGLGLAISKALAEKMNGTIAAASLQGQGSVFTLMIPLEAIDSVTAGVDELGETGLVYMPQTALKNSELHEHSPILLVDDTEPNIMVTKSYLNSMGYPVEIARNGREALAQYRKKKYALILMDIHMPELDGFDVTRAIREQEERSITPYTPIIALTAFASVHDREKCLRHGMDDYISKPFRIEELQEKIEEVLVLHRDGHLPETLH